MTTTVPILSLVVAALAVFVGPFVSWKVAQRQLHATLDVANKQIIAPMRQAWVNNLRDVLAELTSSALHYYTAGFEDRTDDEYQHLTLLEYKVKLMLNPNEEKHQRLEAVIGRMVEMLSANRTIARSTGVDVDEAFVTSHKETVALCREILKDEWDRIKGPIKSEGWPPR